MSWSARSPDLTTFAYFLWVHIEVETFNDCPTTVAEIKAKLSEMIAKIDDSALQTFFENIETRLGFVIRQNTGPFEYLLVWEKLSSFPLLKNLRN